MAPSSDPFPKWISELPLNIKINNYFLASDKIPNI